MRFECYGLFVNELSLIQPPIMSNAYVRSMITDRMLRERFAVEFHFRADQHNNGRLFIGSFLAIVKYLSVFVCFVFGRLSNKQKFHISHHRQIYYAGIMGTV